MSDPGLQRHIVKANFVWDLPNIDSASGVGRKITAALANDWQISGILTAGSAARYDVTVQYQNNGANVNLTGSPDYAPRVVIGTQLPRGLRRSQARPGHRAQLQSRLASPQNQTIRNSQFLANGDVDPARLRTTAAGFGAVNGAAALRAVQLQVRFQF
jgi:hypothetical protein